MGRIVKIFVLISSASLFLAACDKCGGFQDIRIPGAPHSCSDAGRR